MKKLDLTCDKFHICVDYYEKFLHWLEEKGLNSRQLHHFRYK